MTRLPDALHDVVDWEIAVAYHQGYRAALADVAAGHAELDATWRQVGRRVHGQRVAERLAEMEWHARAVRARLDGWSRANPASADTDAWPAVVKPGRRREPRRNRRPLGQRPAAA